MSVDVELAYLGTLLCTPAGANKGVIAARIEDFYGITQQPPAVSQDSAGTGEATQDEAPPGDQETVADSLSAADIPPAEVGTAGLRWAIACPIAWSKTEM